jgi:hypothetical protein
MNTMPTAMRPSSTDSFIEGASNGFINGAIMMGIYTAFLVAASVALPGVASALGVHIAESVGATVLGALGKAAVISGFTVAMTSVFGGVMGMRKAAMEEKQHAEIAGSSMRSAAITQGSPAVVPIISADRAETAARSAETHASSHWRDRVGQRSGHHTSALEEHRARMAQTEAARG